MRDPFTVENMRLKAIADYEGYMKSYRLLELRKEQLKESSHPEWQKEQIQSLEILVKSYGFKDIKDI